MNGHWKTSISKKRKSTGDLEELEDIPVLTRKKSSLTPPRGTPSIRSFFSSYKSKETISSSGTNNHEIYKEEVIVIEEDIAFSPPKDVPVKTPLTSPTLKKLPHASNDFDYMSYDRSYYLDNFTTILETVQFKDVKILTSEDLKIIKTFFQCTQNQQKLIVRLYYRKGPWFQVPKLNYKEISNITQEVSILVQKGILEQATNVNDVIHLLNNNDLKEMMKIKKSMTRPMLLEHAKNWFNNQKTLNGKPPTPPKVLSNCIKIKDEHITLYKLCHRLFFLNQIEDQSLLMMIHTGRVKFPTYMTFPGPLVDIHPNEILSLKAKYGDNNLSVLKKIGVECIFKSREDLVLYEEAVERSRLLAELLGQDLDIENDNTDAEKKRRRSIIKNNGETMQKVMEIVEKTYDQFLELQNNIANSKKDEKDEIPSKYDKNALFLMRFTSEWIYSSIVWVGVGQLEKQRNYEMAITYLKTLLNQTRVNTGRRGEWWIRLTLDLSHVKLIDEALEACLQGIKDPFCRPQHRIRLKNKMNALIKFKQKQVKKSNEKFDFEKFNITIEEEDLHPGATRIIKGIPLRRSENDRLSKSKFIGYDDNPCSVEELALGYYMTKMGYPKGVHSEGDVLVSLFALLFWDIIFDANVPYVFQTPYQDAPLDLTTEAFYESRKERIEERLKLIENSSCDDLNSTMFCIIRSTYDLWVGRTCRGMNWERYTREEFIEIAMCLGTRVISTICRRLAKDYRFTHSGFPDLLLWDPIKKIAKFSEVKSPRDKLSEKQILWIDVLSKAGADIEVFYVKEKLPTDDDEDEIFIQNGFEIDNIPNSLEENSQLELLEELGENSLS